MHFIVRGNVVDVFAKRIFFGEITVSGNKISSVQKLGAHNPQIPKYFLPGFIDSHVHIESSMLVPAEFAKLAVVHGTVATISDPHEIANVCGLAGVDFMIRNGASVPFKFHFGAPSCVPATGFETAGASLDAEEVEVLLARDDIQYLSEMMNFPGVLNKDVEVIKKINAAKKYRKPVDGHAPGLTGEKARTYIEAGISTDHECFTSEEALDKLSFGMKILIREGSAAKNFDALVHLLNEYPSQIMFCSDDKHPDSLVEGHINQLCKRAIALGIDLFNVLQAACINPVNHYSMNVGMLRERDAADFILVEDLVDFNVLQTYIDGVLVAENGMSNIRSQPGELINNFNCDMKDISDFRFLPGVGANGFNAGIPVIEAADGQLITGKAIAVPLVVNNEIVSDVDNDILKIVVVNRYKNAPVAISLIKNFGLKNGAIASSVAHDSHNIIAVGTDDTSICKAVNLVIEARGGISCVPSSTIAEVDAAGIVLRLPVAGLMSNEDGYTVAELYTRIDKAAKVIGSKLSAPFMTLSFMALLVIPHLKLSDLGLFDGDKFELIEQ